MSDDLITRLRGYAACMDIDAYASCDEAADALETQARRIAELEKMIAVHRLAVDVDALKARIAALKAALKPFAELGEMVSWQEPDNCEWEFGITSKNLRAARAAYLGEKK